MAAVNVTTSKRPKKANFTEFENSILLKELKLRYPTITQSSKIASISRRKKKAWAEITDAVNAVGRQNRSRAAIQKRWNDMRDDVKKRRRNSFLSGEGPADKEAPYDDAVLTIIEGSTTLDGIVEAEQGDTVYIPLLPDCDVDGCHQPSQDQMKAEHGEYFVTGQASQCQVSKCQMPPQNVVLAEVIDDTCHNLGPKTPNQVTKSYLWKRKINMEDHDERMFLKSAAAKNKAKSELFEMKKKKIELQIELQTKNLELQNKKLQLEIKKLEQELGETSK